MSPGEGRRRLTIPARSSNGFAAPPEPAAWEYERGGYMVSSFKSGALLAIGLSVAGAFGARADAIEDFYKNKTITIVTSTGPGGAYDIAARTIARYMPKYLPGNPQFVIKNMPGAGHVLATNYMYNQAPKDGTTIATVNNAIPMIQVLDGKGVRFDAAKLKWIGSTGISNLLTVAWAASGVKSMDDVMNREVITGATGTGSGTFIYPTAMNNILGTKFKVVLGYNSSNEVDLAMIRGEVVVRSGASYGGFLAERPDWIREKKINILTQTGGVRDPALPDVPLMSELGKTDEQRQILRLISSSVAMGRPYLAPPETPPERVEALRRAFDKVMKDPGFIADAQKLELDLMPATGEQIQDIARDSTSAPADLVAKAKAAIEPKGAH
jgi:tripartite-type tricarboxylate transporter receptor subunit TctC